MSPPRIAIAHDYLTQRGGAERVVLALARAFPAAPIYTTLYQPSATYPDFAKLDVRPSRLNALRLLRENHRLALPVLPLASSSIHIDADIVVASSSGWAHGFRTSGKKLVYCYSPARWLYEPSRYLGERPSRTVAAALGLLSPSLRRWDTHAAASADRYLAISSLTRDRIRRTYGIDAPVVPAPHSLSHRTPSVLRGRLPEPGYHLLISRLLPYKNVMPVVRAFAQLSGRRLLVVGSGPQKADLIAAAPSNVFFLEGLTDEEMSAAYAGARGLIAASHEDFGLTPLEAAACGVPSAVLRWGGFLDTMVEGETGVFFEAAEPRLIAAAVEKLDARHWDADRLRARADLFSENAFAESIRRHVNELLATVGRDRMRS